MLTHSRDIDDELIVSSAALSNISVVIPVHNEAENLKDLARDLTKSLEDLHVSYEVIFIDDGSNDDSLKILLTLQRQNPRFIVLELTRNFGQHPAILAGFEKARGKIIVTLDADLQNPPEAISLLLHKMKEGYDVVGGWRKIRQDPPIRRLASWAMNRLMSKTTGVKLKDYGCMLRAYRREVVDGIREYGEISSFIPALANTFARRVTEVPVPHRPRIKGASKYNWFRLTLLYFDFLASCSTLGFIGSSIGRIYNEVRRRPRYVIKQTHKIP